MTNEAEERLRRRFAPRLVAMQDGTMDVKIAHMRELQDWPMPLAGADPDAPPPVIPDWSRFISACRRDIEAAVDDTPVTGTLASLIDGAREMMLQRLCRRLSSRHLPPGHAEAVPGLPWSAIRRWAALTDQAAYNVTMPTIPFAVVAGWAATEAASWLPYIDILEDWLMENGGRPSASDHSPITWLNALGSSGWTEFSARIPAAAMPAVRAAIAAAVADLPVPTLEEVQKIVESAEILERLLALGVQRLWVYGSVAAGTAGMGSDVDVLAMMRAPALGSWHEVSELLEGALRQPVDLHVVRTEEAAIENLRGKMVAVLWEAAGS